MKKREILMLQVAYNCRPNNQYEMYNLKCYERVIKNIEVIV